MISYSRGDVIFVDIAFSGAVGHKRRPAVVISTDTFNSAGIKLIVAAITSNLTPPFRPGDSLLHDWSAPVRVDPALITMGEQRLREQEERQRMIELDALRRRVITDEQRSSE